MIGELTRDEKGKIAEDRARYQPSQDVKEITKRIKKDYSVGYGLLHRPFREFNDMSLLQRMDEDQKAFNVYVSPKTDNPDEEWRWHGRRPLTRNKIISMAAHLVASSMYPSVFAQNDRDEEDKEAAEIMRYLVEWNIRNSDYETTFLFGIIAALVNPIAYIEADWSESMQTIREKMEDGNIRKNEVVDDVLSGFQPHNVPADEIMIANPYQFHLQRQRFIIKRRFIDYDEAKTLHGEHDHWKYIEPGVHALYSEDEGVFYDQKDDALKTLCEEVKYLNRIEDIEIPFLNGIYFGNDNTENNPIRHRDNRNRPKYDLIKFGYEPIDEKRFYFYKSAAAALADDQELSDEMWRMIMDGTFLEVMPAMAGIGTGRVDTNILFPGTVTNFDKEARVEAIGTGRNLQAGWEAIDRLEKQAEETSQAKTRAGQAEPGSKTKYEIRKLEENARIRLGIVGRMVVRAVKQFGSLLIDKIIHHQTVGELEEILGGSAKMKYRTFLLPEQMEGGKKVTRKIQFEPGLIGQRISKTERLARSFALLEEEGGLDGEKRIYKVNPLVFSRLRFLTYIDVETLLPKSKAFEEEIKLAGYDRMIQDPNADQEAVSRDFLFEVFAKGESDKYMKSKEKIMSQVLQQPQQPARVPRRSTPLPREAGAEEIIPVTP